MATYTTRGGTLLFITEIADLHATTEARRARHAVGARHRRPVGIDTRVVGIRERETFRFTPVAGILETPLPAIRRAGRGIGRITLQAAIGDARQQGTVARLRAGKSASSLGMHLDEDLVGQELQQTESCRTTVFLTRYRLATTGTTADAETLIFVFVITLWAVAIGLARSSRIGSGRRFVEALLVPRQSSAAVARGGIPAIRVIATVLSHSIGSRSGGRLGRR